MGLNIPNRILFLNMTDGNAGMRCRDEWVRHLYGERVTEREGLNILAFDIELGQTYNELVRNKDGTGYSPGTVGKEDLEFFNTQETGFFVPLDKRITQDIIRADASKRDDDPQKRKFLTTSFYEFLKNFYTNKEIVDQSIRDEQIRAAAKAAREKQ